MSLIELLKDKALMDDAIGWDVMNWKPALEHWFRALEGKKSATCLELGCGPGGLSLLLAKAGLKVTCSDLTLPGDEVRELHRKYGEHKIEYLAVNALDIPFEDKFDFVVFKSVLGGASREGRDEHRHLLLSQIKKCLKPGGVLLFAENTEASPLHMFFRKNFVKWGDSWNYIPLKDLRRELEIFNDVQLKTNGFLGTFGRNEKQRRLLASVDELLLKYLVPSSWKYIAYGTAKA